MIDYAHRDRWIFINAEKRAAFWLRVRIVVGSSILMALAVLLTYGWRL